MADTIMHCFDPGSAEAEGKIIGSLLAGYGELELEMALCLIAATGNYDASLKALYSVRGEEKRIKKADRMMKVQYVNAKLAININKQSQICNGAEKSEINTPIVSGIIRLSMDYVLLI